MRRKRSHLTNQNVTLSWCLEMFLWDTKRIKKSPWGSCKDPVSKRSLQDHFRILESPWGYCKDPVHAGSLREPPGFWIHRVLTREGGLKKSILYAKTMQAQICTMKMKFKIQNRLWRQTIAATNMYLNLLHLKKINLHGTRIIFHGATKTAMKPDSRSKASLKHEWSV